MLGDVLEDFPELKKWNIKITIDHELGYDGYYNGDSSISIRPGEMGDNELRGLIFHDALHVDEAMITVYGSQALYGVREGFSHFFKKPVHDPWIIKATGQYRGWLNNGNKPNTVAVTPNLGNAPWRN